jgi:hypothetical protein
MSTTPLRARPEYKDFNFPLYFWRWSARGVF